MTDVLKNNDEVVLSPSLYKVMVNHYPVVVKMFNEFDETLTKSLGDFIDNDILSINYVLSKDKCGNLIISSGDKQYLCNNILAFCDITTLCNDYIGLTKGSMYIKQFFINLFRYSKQILMEHGISNDKIKNVIVKIGNDYYVNSKSLSKRIQQEIEKFN